MISNRNKLQSPRRMRTGLNKVLHKTYKIGKAGIPVLATLTLPGGKFYRGAKAVKKLAQYYRVQDRLKLRMDKRVAKAVKDGSVSLTGKVYKWVLKQR